VFHLRKASMVFVFITVLLDMIAFGIIVPVFNPLVLSFTNQDYTGASLLNGVFSMIFAMVQLFSSPILGTLADRFGRRPIILLSNLGTALDYLILALAPSLAWLFFGRVLSGATTASVTVASAYVADVTPEDKRAGAYGMISACFGVGFVVGPAIGGLLAAHGLRLPFWVAAAMSLVNFAYGIFVLPESLAPEHRNAFSWSRANPFGAIKMLRRHAELSGLAVMNLIGYVANQALPQLWVFYALFMWSWTMSTIGISLAVVGIVTILVSAVVTQPVVNRLGERRAIVLGLVLGAAGFVLYGTGNQVLFWVAIPVNMLWMIAGSASQALMTRRVGKQEQGELQGAINLLRSVGMIVGPPLFAGVFALSVSRAHSWRAPGAGWFLAAALLVLSAIIALRVTGADDDVKEQVDTTGTLEGALVGDLPVAE
jgi:DHA1 family tetracycline resistance protein-like MFS transporter